MKQLTLTVCIAALCAATATADVTGNSVTVTTPQSRTVTVTALTDNIIRVTNTPAGELPAEETVVDRVREDFSGTVTQYPGGYMISNGRGLSVAVSSVDGAVTISGGNGRTVEDSSLRDISNGKTAISIATTGHCSFYGSGERGHSYDISGDTLVMYNRANYGYGKGDRRNSQMNINMPLVISSKGYALLFDDHAAAEMILSNPIKYITESRHPVTYYFINGAGTLAEITEHLTTLTGRQDLPPFWALGYITSRYGYRTEDETRATVDSLQRAGYPLDGLVLDLYWYGKEQDMGRLSWDKKQWPDHRTMLSDLKKKNVNVTAISQPFVLRNGHGLENYNELSAKGMFVKDSAGKTHDVTIWVGEGGMFDVSNPDTRAWLSERYRQLTDEGMTGWWGDLGEPEVHPETGVHANGLTAREYHNMYGNDWARIIYDLYRDTYPDTRLFTLMRAGTTGLQRYSVFPWSSDVARTWGGLQAQIPVMLNSGLSGLGYMSHDVGGFAVDENLVSDPEMYVRWMQLGLFSPILRTHAQKMAEPYKYTDSQHLLLPLVKERYRWLPYNYTLAYENSLKGLPLVRPLNFYSAGSSTYDDIEDQYLWGRDVMVAPVLEPGARSRRVIFPQGDWVDYNNPAHIYHGGDTIDYAAPIEVLPLFVRAGAFIPQAGYEMSSTADYDPSRYTVQYYPLGDTESEYILFEDDRLSTRSLQENRYTLLTFTGKSTASDIDITVKSDGAYDGMPRTRHITLVIHGITSQPSAVKSDGRNAKYTFSKADNSLTVNLKWTPATDLRLHVTK